MATDFREFSALLFITSDRIETPGSLSVTVDIDTAYSRFFYRSLLFLVSVILRNLLLAGLFLIAFYAVLSRPLEKLVAGFSRMGSVALGAERISVPAGHDVDELGQIAKSGNEFLDAISLHLGKRDEAEAEVRQSEERYRLMIESFPDAMLVANEENTILFVNSGAVQLFGAESGEKLVGRRILDLIHPDDRQELDRHNSKIAEGTAIPYGEMRYFRLDGSELAGETGGVRFLWDHENAALFIVRDVTARNRALDDLRRTEEQLRQAQKMESIGQLTGGVAHDFNNLLTVVLGNLELASEGVVENENVTEYVDRAAAAARTGANLTQRLLAFSRKQALTPKAIDLDRLLDGMSVLIGRTLGETIDVIVVDAKDVWRCQADPAQVESALLNLAINARDAMPDGGQLTIRAENVVLDDAFVSSEPECAPGRYVMISVGDTGSSIDKSIVDRVFEPFFTTKDVGEGSGLGLSMVYGFAKQSGGHVTIVSDKGEGTIVNLYLPKALPFDREPVHEEQAYDHETNIEKARGETILVVEDQTDVRALSAVMLRNFGYTVVEAEDAKSALKVFESTKKVDLLFIDVVLPGGMSGPGLVERVKLQDPDIAVLYTSGYNSVDLVRLHEFDFGLELLKKPFGQAHLASMVRAAIDRAV